jgi:GNAT superfamily N-acetyltransferase
MNVSIRLAVVEDAEAIASIFVNSVKTLCAKDYTHEQVQTIISLHDAESYLEEIEIQQIIIFVAEAETEEIVGFASITENGTALGDLFVHPDCVRQGIGTMLITTLERFARQKQVSRLSVMSSLTGQAFYLACGFQYVKDSGLIDSETGIRVPCVDMVKVLSTDGNSIGDQEAPWSNLATITPLQSIMSIMLAAKIVLES